MYEAIVTKIQHTYPHPNADRIQLATVCNSQVVVGLDVQSGDLGIFFPTDGQLSEEYCAVNDLIARKDEDGNRAGGFFEANRKVRAQRFRGERSEGYFAPLNSLGSFGDYTTLKEGDRFTEFNGHQICQRFETRATRAAKQGQPKLSKKNPYFAEHVDTEQFRYVNRLPDGAHVYITEKLHGTSGRYGHVPATKTIPLKWWEKLLRKKPRKETVYEYLIGTRHTQLADGKEGFYGSEAFRRESVKDITLALGEIIYYELVGYTETGQLIMGQQDTTKTGDKAVAKKYGKYMEYKYGQPVNTCGLYVYRITKVGQDGHVIEYSWPQVKHRCLELGVKTVPELSDDVIAIRGFFGEPIEVDENWRAAIEAMCDGESTLDPTHIREGVVVRVELGLKTAFYKEKSFLFKVLEGIAKESEDYVDTEESS